MNGNLVKAWSVFLVIVALFVTMVEVCYRHHKDASYVFKCRILVNKELIIDENEKKSEDAPKQTQNEDPLYEKTKYGLLPRVPMNGEKVFDRFSAKTIAPKFVKLAVAINNSEKEEDVIKLLSRLGENKITFIIPHYIENFSGILSVILEHGHEVFLSIPTQQLIDDKQHVTPFLANSTPEETKDKLLKLIASATKIIGVANVSSTLLTKSFKDMEVITLELAKRGLAFFDIDNQNNIIESLAKKTGLIYFHVTDSYSAKQTKSLKEGALYFVNFQDVDGFMRLLPEGIAVAPISQDEAK